MSKKKKKTAPETSTPSTDPTEGRSYPRFPFNCPVSVTADLVELKGKTVDISRLGCNIACDKTVAARSDLSLRFHLPQNRVPLKVERAVVRWVREKRFGVHFILMNQQEQKRLQRVLKILEMSPGIKVRIFNVDDWAE